MWNVLLALTAGNEITSDHCSFLRRAAASHSSNTHYSVNCMTLYMFFKGSHVHNPIRTLSGMCSNIFDVLIRIL